MLVLDDVHEIATSVGPILTIEALCRQAPERLHLVVASRDELPFPVERLRGQGQVLEITGSQLAFDVEETATLLSDLTSGAGPDVAADLQRLTGGWPAAVRLAAETLRGVPTNDVPSALDRMRRPGGPLLAYLAAEVFAGEHHRVADLVARVAPLERFTAGLCAALGIEEAEETLHALARRGLFVELQGPAPGWYSLGAPVREFALARLAPSDAEMRQVRITASRWFESRHEPEEALRALPGDETADTARLLETHGGTLLARRRRRRARRGRPAPAEPPHVRSGAARRRGAPDPRRLARGAALLRARSPARRTAPGRARVADGPLAPPRGTARRGRGVYDRADESGEPRDVAMLLAWRASAHWLRADADACRVDATRAFGVASKAGDPQALAAAHTVLAMLAALEGDRGANDAHYLRALEYAQQAGDVLQLVRVARTAARATWRSARTRRRSRSSTTRCGSPTSPASPPSGRSPWRTVARRSAGSGGSTRRSPTSGLAGALPATRFADGLVPAREAGRGLPNPRRCDARARRVRGSGSEAEAAGDVQGLVPALTGLARTIVADEPGEAEGLAERALASGPE